jgi:hypothetical protein
VERGAREKSEKREERSQGDLPACARARECERVRPCRRSAAAEPSPIPHPHEEQPLAGCCFPTASSGPLSSRRRAASHLPSLFPTRVGADADEQVFPPPPLVLPRAGAGPEPPPPVFLFPRAGAGPLKLGNTLLLLCIFVASSLASSALSRAGQQHVKQNNKQVLSARCSVLASSSSRFVYICLVASAWCLVLSA